jgi:CHAD domain-containing protein
MDPELHTEVERKYDVASGAVVPDLTGVDGVAHVSDVGELHQEATYFDTEDLRLLRFGVTLRRRTGGVDDGWHLKLPGEDGSRQEVRLPLGEPGAVPDALLDRVRAVVRDAPVAPTAVLRTRRLVRRLHDAGDASLGELTDDRVTAEVAGTSTTSWREWELELVDATDALFDTCEPLLLAAGASPAHTASKVGRALGERLGGQRSWLDVSLGEDPTTGEVLVSYVRDQLLHLERQDQALRGGDEEGIHQLRVAARRIRSALATYRPVLDREATDPLRDELQWFGGVLAHARDMQVMLGRLEELLDRQPSELVLGPVRSRLEDELRAAYRTGREAAAEMLDGARYFRMLDRLEAFVLSPPLTGKADRPARKVLPRLLRRDLTRVRDRDRAVEAATDEDARVRALHDVRKAAKRLRYAAEGAVPVLGAPAAELAAAAEAIQDVLGEHQDTVVARRSLREIGVRAHLSGENGFTFGRLHSLEEARAAALAAEYPARRAALPEPRSLKSWS